MMEPIHLSKSVPDLLVALPRAVLALERPFETQEDVPDDRGNHDRRLPAKHVGEETRGQRTKPGTSSHTSGNSAGHCSPGPTALRFSINVFQRALVEVAQVRLGGNDRLVAVSHAVTIRK